MSTNNDNEVEKMYQLVKPFLGYKAMRFDKFYDVRQSNLQNMVLDDSAIEKEKSYQQDYLNKVYEFFSDPKNCKDMEKTYNISLDAKEFLQYLYLDYAENQHSGMLDQEALEFIEEKIGYYITGKRNNVDGFDEIDDFRNNLKTIFRSPRLTKNIEDIKAKNDAMGVYAVVDNKSYLMASVSNLIRYYKRKYNLNNDELEILYERVVWETRRYYWEHFWGFWSLNILLSFATVGTMVGFVFAFIPLAAPLAFIITTSVCIAINYWINCVRYPKEWSWKSLKTYRPALNYFKSKTFKQNIGLEKAEGELVEVVQPLQNPPSGLNSINQVSNNSHNQAQNNSQNNDEQPENKKPVVVWLQKTNSKLKYKLFTNICWSLFKFVFVFAVVFLAFNFIPGAFTFLSGVKTFASVDVVVLAKIVEFGSYVLSGLTILLGAGTLIGKRCYSSLKNDKIVVDNRNDKHANILSVFGIDPKNVKPMPSQDNSSTRTTVNTTIENNQQ